jgi:hypothetical protein
MSTRLALLALVAAAIATPVAAADLPAGWQPQEQWDYSDETMYALVQRGFEIKSTVNAGRDMLVFLQNGKDAYYCTLGTSMVQFYPCARLVKPQPLKK